MVGLSKDIELGLKVVLEGLDYSMDIDGIDPDKIKVSTDSKLASFRTAKELLSKWVNSPNAPTDTKFSYYVEALITSGGKSLKTLRKALRAPINYDELDEHKHKLASQTKLTVLNSINELDSSLIELRNQYETGTVILKEAEFKRGFAEKFAYGEFFPLKNYYKKWHNKEEDAIVIDPKGSRGEIITLDGLKVQLPLPPRDKSKILFSDKLKKDQYWVREEIPKGLSLDNTETYMDYIMEQFRCRREGVWFMNKGKPTWLSPKHWMQLQWGKMFDDMIYPSYRHAQLLLYYHKEACYVDKMCMGQIFLKSRQTGYTYGMMSDSLELVTRTKGASTGLTSMTDDDARKAFAKMSYTFQEWPFFFQPITKGKVDSPTNIKFGKPSNDTKEQKKKKVTSTDGYVNSQTDFQATKTKAYDGQHMKLYIGDECYSPDTEILMSDMSFKKIIDIKPGDFVIVEGGKTIEVGEVYCGLANMYEIIQPHGKNYIVSKNHTLLFEQGGDKKRTKDIMLKPEEYLLLSGYNKRITRKKTFSGINFPKRPFFIDPYILGLWLGDGTTGQPKFTINHKKDPEILKEVLEYSDRAGLTPRKEKEEGENFQKWYLKDNTGHANRFNKELRRLGIFRNKRIPKEFLLSSIEQRLSLLAGLIDSDGSKQKKSSNVFVIGMSRKGLVEDIYNIAKSCGLDTSEVRESETNFKTKCYRVSIVDYGARINPRVVRKKPTKTPIKKRKAKVEGIKRLGIGEFYGITLKSDCIEDRRIVLKDYTVSLNCAKWERASYIEHLNTLLPTTFRGGRVVGKVFLGSTMGKLDAGGEDFKVLYLNSKVLDRQPSGYTSTKLYSYFMPAHTNYEECIDIYGRCWEAEPPKGTLNTFGDDITKGSIQMIKEQYADAKLQGDAALNAAYRAFPMTEAHAMRDEAEACVFNLTKLTDQWDYNEELTIDKPLYTRGNFRWREDNKFTDVIFTPDDRGRFKIAWMPNASDDTLHLRNNVSKARNQYAPMNDYGCIGVDCFGSFVQGKNKASKGAAHAYTKANSHGVPPHQFLFEYIDRPATQDVFNEDILMAAWFYGIPILAESNVRDFVRSLFNANCRPFSMNRVDKTKLDGDDLVLGGQNMQSKDIRDAHENGIRTHIQRHVGFATAPEGIKYRPEGKIGVMPFNDTVMDWMKFNPSARTAHDATISSGLSIMGCNRERYKPQPKKDDVKRNRSIIRTYDNRGDMSTFKKRRPLN